MIIQELRIGNWVNITGQPVLIKETTYSPYIADNCRANNTPIDQIEPILLTKEILQKAGFKKNTENIFKYLDTMLYLGPNFVDYYQFGSPIKKDINSLHQLQNLYLDLTGTELKIVL